MSTAETPCARILVRVDGPEAGQGEHGGRN